MSLFKEKLTKLQPDPKNRIWLFITYDQLSDSIGPLSYEDPTSLGIVLVENPWKAARRPYHKQKLALILSNLRHFALELALKGIAARHVIADGPYRMALKSLIAELGPLRVMTPAERELRVDLQPLVESGGIETVPHEGWVTTSSDFEKSGKKVPPGEWMLFTGRFDAEQGFLWRGKNSMAVNLAMMQKTDSPGEEFPRLQRCRLSHPTPSRRKWEGSSVSIFPIIRAV